jgi:hypothetical protein
MPAHLGVRRLAAALVSARLASRAVALHLAVDFVAATFRWAPLIQRRPQGDRHQRDEP